MRADGEQQSAALKEFAAVNTLVQLTNYKVEFLWLKISKRFLHAARPFLEAMDQQRSRALEKMDQALVAWVLDVVCI